MRAELVKYGQEHLLQHWGDLSADQQAALYDDIREFDLQEVTEYFKKTVAVLEHEGEKLDDRYDQQVKCVCLNTMIVVA